MNSLSENPRLVVLSTVLLAVSAWIYNEFNSPMGRLPGPWHTRWTNVVMKYKMFKGQLIEYTEKLHEEYGPVVRIAPNQTSIRDPCVSQTVYKTKGEYLKSEFYDRITGGFVSVFNTRDVDVHRRYRRLLSAGMTESNMLALYPIIDGKVRLAIQRMGEEMETRGAADVFHWCLSMATDVIGELSFGQSFEMLESGKKSQYIEDLQTIAVTGGVLAQIPKRVKDAAYAVGLPLVTKVVEHRKRIAKYADDSISRHYKIVEEEGDDSKPTLLSKLYNNEEMTSVEVRDAASSYIVAGSDTTANTLTYLFYLVSAAPDIKARLLNELQTLPDGFVYEHVKSLPYLNKVIEETLRLYPAASGILPRVVPNGGVEMKGHYLPGGSVVGSSAYVLQRNPAVFPDPLKFDPSRWDSPTQEMKQSFMAFGAASRICLGQHLARMELRLATARFFLTYPNSRVSSKEGFGAADMAPQMFFLLAPKNKRCLLEVS